MVTKPEEPPDKPSLHSEPADGASGTSPPEREHLDESLEEMHERLASDPDAFKVVEPDTASGGPPDRI
jgi:hypothetical protein